MSRWLAAPAGTGQVYCQLTFVYRRLRQMGCITGPFRRPALTLESGLRNPTVCHELRQGWVHVHAHPTDPSTSLSHFRSACVRGEGEQPGLRVGTGVYCAASQLIRGGRGRQPKRTSTCPPPQCMWEYLPARLCASASRPPFVLAPPPVDPRGTNCPGAGPAGAPSRSHPWPT